MATTKDDLADLRVLAIVPPENLEEKRPMVKKEENIPKITRKRKRVKKTE